MARRSYEIANVLMTTQCVGSAWSHALDLARGIAAHGVRTTLATIGGVPTASQKDEAKRIQGLELHCAEHRPRSEEIDRWLLALADRSKVDIVHLDGFDHAALPWNVPSLVAVHGDRLSRRLAVRPGLEVTADLNEYRQLVRRGIAAASLVVTPTQAGLDDLEANYGLVADARVIPVGKSMFDAMPERKRQLVLSAARCWEDSKNLGLLQRTAERLDWPIYVAGDLPQDRQPRVQGVNFLGRLGCGALGSWFSRAAIYAVPAKYDPDGASALEAALFGCALVLADIPSLRELWDGAAIFAPVDDSAAFASAVKQLADDPRHRREMAARATARAKEYSLEEMAGAYLFAYQDLKQSVGLDLAVIGHPGVSLL